MPVKSYISATLDTQCLLVSFSGTVDMILTVFPRLFFAKFKSLTSKEISSVFDSHFNPATQTVLPSLDNSSMG